MEQSRVLLVDDDPAVRTAHARLLAWRGHGVQSASSADEALSFVSAEHDIDVIFVDEPDTRINPLGTKGVGEIGIVGTAAAIVNAVYHATGKRLRNLPIRIEQLL